VSSVTPDLKQVLGVSLFCDPARAPTYKVVQLPKELCEYHTGTSEWYRESLHRHFNTEVQSLEIAAKSLADFPDAPWDLRMQHARQCWDESRHARLIERELIARGGFAGEFPIINFDWGVACAIGTLVGRLAVQNRTVEAGEMDLLQQLRDTWQAAGAPTTAAVMDGILADEIQHVRFANQWVKSEIQRNPRLVMDVAKALSYVHAVTEAFTPVSDEKNRAGVLMSELNHSSFALNTDDRRLAGFGEADLAALQAGEGR
jgi:uncharacterized ferritin-like protein (DUF455 family)